MLLLCPGFTPRRAESTALEASLLTARQKPQARDFAWRAQFCLISEEGFTLPAGKQCDSKEEEEAEVRHHATQGPDATPNHHIVPLLSNLLSALVYKALALYHRADQKGGSSVCAFAKGGSEV